MIFEWDESKRRQTLQERNLDFVNTAEAWLDKDSIEMSVKTDDELRIVKIAKFIDKKIYVVVFTHRERKIRIISFRRASKKFEEIYEKK